MSKIFRLIVTWLALLLTSLSLQASARQAPRPTARPVALAPLARPALWKVEDADTTIYLFGTIHLLPKGLRWFAGPIETAFNSSDEFVSELGETNPADIQAVTVTKAFLPPDQSLRALLSPAQKAQVEKALTNFK